MGDLRSKIRRRSIMPKCAWSRIGGPLASKHFENDSDREAGKAVMVLRKNWARGRSRWGAESKSGSYWSRLWDRWTRCLVQGRGSLVGWSRKWSLLIVYLQFLAAVVLDARPFGMTIVNNSSSTAYLYTGLCISASG